MFFRTVPPQVPNWNVSTKTNIVTVEKSYDLNTEDKHTDYINENSGEKIDHKKEKICNNRRTKFINGNIENKKINRESKVENSNVLNTTLHKILEDEKICNIANASKIVSMKLLKKSAKKTALQMLDGAKKNYKSKRKLKVVL